MPILAIHSSTISLQSTGKQGFQTLTGYRKTDIATYRLNQPRGRFSENSVDIFCYKIIKFEEKKNV